ncbi:MAG: DNA replication and repair protein RecF, partial [Clostridia bacterium]|nr:DNA replication and repair protein RecF [Clostridia bacterium]
EERLKESRKNDSFTGFTSLGPHRDDVDFKINGISARTYGSQGQQRSVALALKFASSGVIKEITGEYPICLLDDVMSELDTTRQNYILNHIKGWQTFITCCDPSNVQNLKDGKIFNIKNGGVV